MEQGELNVELLGRGIAWLDTGTYQSLMDAGNFIGTIESRQGLMVACLEEIAFNAGYITADAVLEQAKRYRNTEYGNYLNNLIKGG
jgi:glucose-1-phosphate thymidylyltransferase